MFSWHKSAHKRGWKNGYSILSNCSLPETEVDVQIKVWVLGLRLETSLDRNLCVNELCLFIWKPRRAISLDSAIRIPHPVWFP